MAGADDPLRTLRRRHRRDLRRARAEGMLAGVASMLRPGDVTVDCGANRGDVTALLAASGAEVHAFEPDPYNLEKLTERFAGLANVRLHAAAVGTEAGTIRLMRAANWEANPDLASVKSTVVAGGQNIAEGEGIAVALVDFPAFLRGLVAAHGRVAFVKLDIEGAELALLSAMLDQRLFDRIQLTVAETHERKFKDLRPRFAALREAVAAAYPPSRVNLDWI
ncbi:FkbM family methyltransferase [Tabrizicola sp.]|jgi:FkbM family methyltransferase|uniref:FkbM family methyltransferase n=1 Tax=Tabrizicola sp. TaxID=2005166 RepID=UPI000BC75245|nr:FkbM family methyltransferase [Tabrizicola sp.]MBY0352380.1 FkbM family methyltransferase [Tabrizicola sp.]OYX18088.1 MAG: FkbM family methyltransferase [Rhodobacterales bacterium 32-66-9]